MGTPPLQLEREIAATDAEIDDLVYELYGITLAGADLAFHVRASRVLLGYQDGDAVR